jgi:hypothetical protein
MQQMSGLLEEVSDVGHGATRRNNTPLLPTTEAQAWFPVKSATLIDLFVPLVSFSALDEPQPRPPPCATCRLVHELIGHAVEFAADRAIGTLSRQMQQTGGLVEKVSGVVHGGYSWPICSPIARPDKCSR